MRGACAKMDVASTAGYSPPKNDVSAASQAETTRKRPQENKGPFTKDLAPADMNGYVRVGSIMHSVSPLSPLAFDSMDATRTSISIEAGSPSVDCVISRLHYVRSSIKEGTDTNHALLQSLSEKIADGQRAGQSGMSEAMKALERQRQETAEARAAAKQFQEHLFIAQHELTRALDENRSLVLVKGELSNCERLLAAERLVRTDLQARLDMVTTELKQALAKLNSQECDLEIMCEDLAKAEGMLETTNSTALLLQAECAKHQRERAAEEATLSRVEAVYADIECKMQCLEEETSAQVSLSQKMQNRNQLLQHQLTETLEHMSRLEGELVSANTKVIEKEHNCEQLRSELQQRGTDFDELCKESMRDFTMAQARIAMLEIKCKEAETELNQERHELSERILALSRIFEVACGDQNWQVPKGDVGLTVTQGDVGLTVMCGELNLHVIEASAAGLKLSYCVVVQKIAEGGAAADDGRLEPGHFLHSVDGRDVTSFSQSQVHQLLAGPVGSSVRLVLQRGIEGVKYEAVLVRRAERIILQQSASCQASSVCHVIHNMREQLGALQQAHARSVFELSRRTEAEKQRVAGSHTAITDVVDELKRIRTDLLTEQGCIGSIGAHFEQLQAEHEMTEQKLMHTINVLTQSNSLLNVSNKTVEGALQQSDLEVRHLKSALESEKQKLTTNEIQLKEARDQLKKLVIDFDSSVRQVEQLKEKHGLKNEEWELARAELKSLRQELAGREHDLTDCKVLVAHMHRAVCGKFKKTGIGIKLKVSKENGSSDRAVFVEELVAAGAADCSGRIQVGDLVLGIDGTNPSSMSEDLIRSKLTGPVGSSVTLMLRRPRVSSHSEEFQLTLLRKAPAADKQTSEGQAAEAIDCAHALFIEMQQMSTQYAMQSSVIEVQKISMENFQQQNSTLKVDVDKVSEEVNQLHKQIEVLEKELDKSQTASVDMGRKSAGFLKELDVVTKQLADANEKILRLSAQIAESQRELQAECSRSQHAAKESAGVIADLRGGISMRDNKASMMKLEIERLKSESTLYRVENESLKAQILQSQNTNEELKDLLRQSRQENNRLLEHLESEKRRAETMESRLTIALAGSHRLDLEKAGVSSNLAELEKRYEDALEHTKSILKRLEDAHEELQVLRSEVTRLTTDKQELEEARAEADASLERALRGIEILNEEADKASCRLKAELENAGNLLQDQAEVNAMVLREKGMMECDLAAAKERIAMLEAQAYAASTEHNLLKAKLVGLEDELIAGKIMVDQGLDREVELSRKFEAIQHENTDAILMIRDFSTTSENTLAESVRKLIKTFKKVTNDKLHLENELCRLQASLSEALSKIEWLQGLRDSDGLVARELHCDKEALENKIRLLQECLDKEQERCSKVMSRNEKLFSDLKDAGARGDHTSEILISVQEEMKRLSADFSVLQKTCSSQQADIAAISVANRTLDQNLKNSKECEVRTAQQLQKCETALADAQVREIECAQRFATSEKACETLQAKNASLCAQLHRSAVHGKELREHIACLYAGLKDNEEYLLDQMFVIEGLRNELSGKCQALHELNPVLATAERDREQLMRKSLQLESLAKQEAANARRLSLAQTTMTVLLDGVARAQEEMQELNMEFCTARSLVERQIGLAMSALTSCSPRETAPLHLTTTPRMFAGMQDNLISSLAELEHLRALLDTRRDALRNTEQERAEAASARLRLELSQATALIACLEQDRDRNTDELHFEKEGHQILSQKLIMSEQRKQESELMCINLEQELARLKFDRESNKKALNKAVEEILRLTREAKGQCAVAKDFFTVSLSQLCFFSETYKSSFSHAAHDIAFIEGALRDQERVNTSLSTDLAFARTLAGKLEGELAELQDGLSSMRSVTNFHVHEITGVLEVAKGDVRQAAWALEGDCTNMTNLVQRQAEEIAETHRQVLLGRDQVRDKESEIHDLRNQLEDVKTLAEARKCEIEEMCSLLQHDRQMADEALQQTEEAVSTISAITAELATTKKDLVAQFQFSYAAEQETQKLKDVAEKQLNQVRCQLYTHTSGVQERIMALQIESEELHTAISGIVLELGLLRADFRREMGSLNVRIFDFEVHQKVMLDTIERKERELAHREAEMEKIARNLEVLMDKLREGERRQHLSHLACQSRASTTMEAMQMHAAKLLHRRRDQRKLVRIIKFWREISRRNAWAKRTAAGFLTRVYACMQHDIFRLWTRVASGQRENRTVRRWEMLAVGAAVCGLGARARAARGASRMQNAVLRSSNTNQLNSHGGISHRSNSSNRSWVTESSLEGMVPNNMETLRLGLGFTSRRLHSAKTHTSPDLATSPSNSVDLHSTDLSCSIRSVDSDTST